jgi:hypothetical protein
VSKRENRLQVQFSRSDRAGHFRNCGDGFGTDLTNTKRSTRQRGLGSPLLKQRSFRGGVATGRTHPIGPLKRLRWGSHHEFAPVGVAAGSRPETGEPRRRATRTYELVVGGQFRARVRNRLQIGTFIDDLSAGCLLPAFLAKPQPRRVAERPFNPPATITHRQHYNYGNCGLGAIL